MPLYLTETYKAVHLAGVFLTAQEKEIAGKYFWTDIERVSFLDGEEEYDDEIINLGKLFGHTTLKKRNVVEIYFELKNGRKFSFVHRPDVRTTVTIGGRSRRYATKGEIEAFKKNFLTLFENSKKAPEPEETDEEKKRNMLGIEVWLILTAGLITFMYYVPIQISGQDRSFINGLVYALPIFLFPFLVYKTVRSFKPGSGWRYGLAVLSLFIITPAFVFYIGSIDETELKKNGVWTKGNVIEEAVKDRRGNVLRELYCVFKVDGKTYKTIINQKYLKPNEYKNGDSLDLIYSKVHPNIHKFGMWAEKYGSQKNRLIKLR